MQSFQLTFFLLLLACSARAQTIQWGDYNDLKNLTSPDGLFLLIELPDDPFVKRVDEEFNDHPNFSKQMSEKMKPVRIKANKPVENGKTVPTGFALAQALTKTKILGRSPTLIIKYDENEPVVLQGAGEILNYMREDVWPKTDPEPEPVVATSTPAPSANNRVSSTLEKDRKGARSFMNTYYTSPDAGDAVDELIYKSYRDIGMHVYADIEWELSRQGGNFVKEQTFYNNCQYVFILVMLDKSKYPPRIDLWNRSAEKHYAKMGGRMVERYGVRTIFYEYTPTDPTHRAEIYFAGTKGAKFRLYMGMRMKE